MKDLMLSIIVPVYNIERWIDRCIESVLPAVPESGEILLVVGESSDNSNAKCQAWEKRDPRITVLFQSGKGLADARNCGVEHSRGAFLMYVDGDDFVDTAQLGWLLGQLPDLEKRVQVVMTDYCMTDTDGHVLEKIDHIGPEILISTQQSLIEKALKKKKCFWNVWRYIYRQEFLLTNKIAFLENTLSEDMDYTAKVFAARPYFAFAHCPFYQYCVGRGDSLMDYPTLNRLQDTVAHIVSGVERINETNAPYALAFIAQYQFEYLLNLALCVEVPTKDRKSAYSLYQTTYSVLNYGQDAIVCIFRRIMHIASVPLLAHAFHTLKKLRRAVHGNHRVCVIEKGL